LQKYKANSSAKIFATLQSPYKFVGKNTNKEKKMNQTLGAGYKPAPNQGSGQFKQFFKFQISNLKSQSNSLSRKVFF